MKKMNLKTMLGTIVISALSLSLLTGCGGSGSTEASAEPGRLLKAETDTAKKAAGTLLLSVNPEIEVEYDDKGYVIKIDGVNDDGRGVITGYSDYEGRACEQVVNELVQRIYKSGYFDGMIGGKTKNIVIKLEKGSAYPGDAFLENVAQGARDAVQKCGVPSMPMTVGKDDYAEDGYIGLEKAKELVLAQLGLEEAAFTEKEYKLDDGVYELEFTSAGTEYEFEVDAVSGKVLEADYENNDDWDDVNDNRDDVNDMDDVDDDRDDMNDADDSWDDVNDDRNDADDSWDDVNDDRDDADDSWDDVNDDRDDADDSWDEVNDDKDDADDNWDDVNDDRDDADDSWDDVDDDRDNEDDDWDDTNDADDEQDDVDDDEDD